MPGVFPTKTPLNLEFVSQAKKTFHMYYTEFHNQNLRQMGQGVHKYYRPENQADKLTDITTADIIRL